jgi:GT2 family glycosyltransferase
VTDSLPIESASLVVGAEVAGDGAPAVVAVLVVREGDDQLGVTLQSLADQDYENLDVLVIDATGTGGESSVADDVASVMPDASLNRLSGNPSFGAAANHASGLVSGGAFFLFCSERVDLDHACVSSLVEELYRSNAGVVTPKFVRWDDPRRLAAIGRGSDRFGVQVDLVEPLEFDQEQHDAVRDVFVAPEGVQLVRADLFRALGGFDTTLESVSEDLDFCWRAQVAGARVVAVPGAKVRLRSVELDEVGTDNRRRLLGRNRLRTLLVTSSRFSLLRVVPLAILLLVLEGAYALLAGRRRQAGAAFAAIGANVARWGEIRKRRRELQALRQVPDRGVHALQTAGSARLNAFFRGQFSVSDRLVGFVGGVRSSFAGAGSSSLRDGSVIGVFIGLIVVFGSRKLISGGVAPVGQFLELPEGGALLREWLGSWRTAGTGGAGNAPTAFGVLGLLRLVFFWGDGLLDLLLVLVPLIAGVVGAWRLAAPLASPRAAGLAALAYLGNPLLPSIFSAGRWDALVVWGVAPFLLGSLLRIQGAAPFGGHGGRQASVIVDRPEPIRILRFGLLVAMAATFVPAVILVAVLMTVTLMIGSMIVLRPVGQRRLLVAGISAVFVPGAMHAPWTFDVLRRFRWDWFVGPGSPEAAFDSLADIVRFAPGLAGPKLLVFGLLFAAFAALLIANDGRLALAGQAWVIALGSFALLWADRRGWLPASVPAGEILLVPAAASLSLAVGVSVRALDVDLVGYRFGWRQIIGFGAVVAMVGSALVGFQASVDGRWGLAEHGYGRSTQLLVEQYEGSARVLWLGDPSVVPIDTQRSPAGTSFAVSGNGSADVRGRWVPDGFGRENAIGDRLDLAGSGDTARLGRLLAPYGIDLIVVVAQLAPAPYQGPQHSPGGEIVAGLASQLDLQRVTGTVDLVVYRNTAALGPFVSLVDGGLPAAGDALTQLNTDLSTGERVVTVEGRPNEVTFANEAVGQTLLSVSSDGWSADNEQVTLSNAFDGLLVAETSVPAGTTFSYPTSLTRRLALVGQLLLVLVGFLLSRLREDSSQATITPATSEGDQP